MYELSTTIWLSFTQLIGQFSLQNPGAVLGVMPLVFLFEIPYYLFIFLGVMRFVIKRTLYTEADQRCYPKISCLVSCYCEGEAIQKTLLTLCEQNYPGTIEIICIIDGAIQNKSTLEAAQKFAEQYSKSYPNRMLRILPKWQRGGRVSSLNAGFSISNGEIIMALDGDTSFDNDMALLVTRHFSDPKVCAVAGALEVRNAKASLIAELQNIEYKVTIAYSKIGLSEFNVINNISGAFGVFRKTTLNSLGGWSTGTAEDLDFTIRLKQYTRRNQVKIAFEPLAIGYTDAPTTFWGFLMQRLRWDGDLIFIYLYKHKRAFQPKLVGWPNFILLIRGGLFFQLVSPFMISFYLIYILITTPFTNFIAIGLFIYLFYLTVTLIQYILYLIVSSQNPLNDSKEILFLPIYQFFGTLTRLWSVVCILNQIFRRGHEESAMAPWWVLKRPTKFTLHDD
jgi:cellulose synthase/poly-beta-1,6-N-acetylglucosamine synthase-like glycosyltransferase